MAVGKGVKAADTTAKVAAAPAKDVVNAALSMSYSKHGISTVFRPQVWYLYSLKVFLSQPMLIFFVFIIANYIVWSYFCGLINVHYAIYFAKAYLCVAVNTVLSILNAVLFAVHGVTVLVSTAMLDIINGVAHHFIQPILQGVNNVIGFLNIGFDPIIVDPIGEGMPIPFQPSHGFSYWMPATVIGPGASLLGFIPVAPGMPIYETDASGAIIYDEVYDQSGAKLLMPRMDEDSKAQDDDGEPGWWTKIPNRDGMIYTPEIPFSVTPYAGQTLIQMVQKWFGEFWDSLTGAVETATEPENIAEQSSPMWFIKMPWLVEVVAGWF